MDVIQSVCLLSKFINFFFLWVIEFMEQKTTSEIKWSMNERQENREKK